MGARDDRSRNRGLPAKTGNPVPAASGESLVPDARAGLTPSQMVDRKLAALLRGTSRPDDGAAAGGHAA